MAVSSSSSSSPLILTLALFLVLTPSAHSLSCTTQKFTSKKAFDTCLDLPTLGSYLHYTYNGTTSTLSMAFTAPPPDASGWVSWAINPTETGMVGAQSLIAFKQSDGSIAAQTYDLQSYGKIVQGPISYKVTGISAEQSDGMITIFADWALPEGTKEINQVWQVGPVSGGKVGKHEFKPENLDAKSTLSLTESSIASPAGEPTMSPAGEPTMSPADSPMESDDAPVAAGPGSAPVVSESSSAISNAPSPASSGAAESLMKKLGASALLGLVISALF